MVLHCVPEFGDIRFCLLNWLKLYVQYARLSCHCVCFVLLHFRCLVCCVSSLADIRSLFFTFSTSVHMLRLFVFSCLSGISDVMFLLPCMCASFASSYWLSCRTSLRCIPFLLLVNVLFTFTSSRRDSYRLCLFILQQFNSHRILSKSMCLFFVRELVRPVVVRVDRSLYMLRLFVVIVHATSVWIIDFDGRMQRDVTNKRKIGRNTRNSNTLKGTHVLCASGLQTLFTT